MSLPIKETPILKGKDAKRFIKKMHEVDLKGPSKKDLEDYKRAKKIYDKLGELP